MPCWAKFAASSFFRACLNFPDKPEQNLNRLLELKNQSLTITISVPPSSSAAFTSFSPLVTLQRLSSSPKTSSTFSRPISIRASFPAMVFTE